MKQIAGRVAPFAVPLLAAPASAQNLLFWQNANRQLASVGNRQLTPDAVSKVDNLLAISGADPAPGTTQ